MVDLKDVSLQLSCSHNGYVLNLMNWPAVSNDGQFVAALHFDFERIITIIILFN